MSRPHTPPSAPSPSHEPPSHQSSSHQSSSHKGPSGSGSLDEPAMRAALADLMGQISTLPLSERRKLEQVATESQERHARLRATVSGLQESLDYLRLSIKYLVFDLEATRRENRYLRRVLEESVGND